MDKPSKIHFKPALHTVRMGDAIEIWDDGVFIGAIYPIPSGIRVMSKHPHIAKPNGTHVDIFINHADPIKVMK